MVLVTTTDILKVLSDRESLELFRIVALTKPDTASADIIKSKTKLTRKQYYSRMSRLMKAGLIKRKNGKYNLIALGKVVYNTQMKIENGVNNYWNLKAIDSLEDSDNLPAEERKRLIDELIDNQEIKNILVPYNEKDNNKLESAQPSLGITENNKKSK
jgi:predicted transcriptional regulator